MVTKHHKMRTNATKWAKTPQNRGWILGDGQKGMKMG